MKYLHESRNLLAELNHLFDGVFHDVGEVEYVSFVRHRFRSLGRELRRHHFEPETKIDS